MIFVSYVGKKWAFIESIYLKIGEDPKEFKFAITPIRRVLNPLVAELAPVYISDEDINFLSKICISFKNKFFIESLNSKDKKFYKFRLFLILFFKLNFKF